MELEQPDSSILKLVVMLEPRVDCDVGGVPNGTRQITDHPLAFTINLLDEYATYAPCIS